MLKELKGTGGNTNSSLSIILRLLGCGETQSGTQSIRQRAAIFFAIFAILLIVSLGYLFWQGRQIAKNLDHERQSSRTDILSGLSELRGDQLKTFVYDYSYWEEVIDFMSSADSTWAKENLDPSVRTYQFEGLMVLNLTREVVYSSTTDESVHLHAPQFPEMNETEWAQKDFSLRFFEANGRDVHEYAVAPLQYERDDTTNGKLFGYLVAMREWDETELQFFNETSEGVCSLITDTSFPNRANFGSVTAILPLLDINGNPVAWIRNDFHSSLLSEIENTQRMTFVVVGVFTLILLLGGGLLIRNWFLLPLGSLQKALESKNPMVLSQLDRQPREIESSLKLLQDLLTNQASLESEVETREHAEAVAVYHSRQMKEAIAERDFVLEQAKVALYRHDRNGNFLYFSPGIKTITGYEPEELLRHYSYLLTNDPMNLVAMRSTERALETGEPQEPYVMQIRRKDGSIGYLEATEIPFYEDVEVAGIVGVCRDISAVYEMRLERDRLTASVEKSKRMESIVVLAGGVAHDLNNTLGPLVSYPSLIREQSSPDSKTFRYATTMEQAARQAAEIVKDLLILARRGRLTLEPHRFSDIATNALQSAAVQERLKDKPLVSLQTHFPDAEPQIMASSSHLIRSIQNLVINALEAIESEGVVTVSLNSRIDKRTDLVSQNEEDRQMLVLSVSDTGVGISEEQISKIFEPYYSTKQMGRSGSGLGLALVYSIVRDHGGYHEVSSVIGKGTTISLVLPAAPELQEVIPTQSGEYRRASILVVDDLEIQRDLLKTILESRGHHVVAAASTNEALDIYKTHTFDIALLDMILEEKTDGADLYASLLAVRSPLPCVIVSGFGPSHRMDYAMRLGAHGILSKPYTISQLEQVIEAALEASSKQTDMVVVGTLSPSSTPH